MGIWDWLKAPAPAVDPDEIARQRFAVGLGDIDPATVGLASWDDIGAARVSRSQAMSVPAVKRARDLFAFVIGQLPIDVFGPDRQPLSFSLLAQPEKGIARSVTMARLVEDLLFEGVAWWWVTERGWHGFPVQVKRLDPRTVSVRDEQVWIKTRKGNAGTADERVEDRDLIRFDSPTDPLLVSGARAIRALLNLEKAAAAGAGGTPPIDYFAPSSDIDPFETDEEVSEFLTNWETYRRKRRTGYVPAGVELRTHGWSPEQLQLSAQRDHAVKEIARLTGIDSEELAVPTSTRTYFNAQDRRKAFLDFVIGGYRQAIEDRLSMPDVTPAGYTVKFNLSAFLRTDDLTRMQTYEVALRVGALTRSEIRELEDRPALSPEEETEAVAAQTEHEIARFDTATPPAVMRFAAPTGQRFEVEPETRTIKGIAVPYGRIPNDGRVYVFGPGSVTWTDPKRVKLLVNHDPGQAIGHAVAFEDSDEGLFATFKVARGPEGDRALTMAEDGVWDGLSVGIGVGMKTRYDRETDTLRVLSAPLVETSLTPFPAFDDARVASVAASAAPKKGNKGMDNAADLADGQIEQPGALDFTPITNAIREGFANLPKVPAPQSVPAAAAARFDVSEPVPYRFDGTPGEHDFSTDLFDALRFGNGEATQRVQTFIRETFGVATTDVDEVQPPQQRPDLYIDYVQGGTPVYNAIVSGRIADPTPMVIPAYSSDADLVADHSEGSEPSNDGDFATTSVTVTPAAISGYVPVNREVIDAGGNPVVSQLIWRQMNVRWLEQLEAKAAGLLTSSAATELGGSISAGAANEAVADAVEDGLIGLQFVKGGDRFSRFVGHVELFKALANARQTTTVLDTNDDPVDVVTGHKRYPMVNPSNATGSAAARFRALDVAGFELVPAASLGASGTGQKSYIFAPESVLFVHSEPQRIDWITGVSAVNIGFFGYYARQILNVNLIRKITYDSTP